MTSQLLFPPAESGLILILPSSRRRKHCGQRRPGRKHLIQHCGASIS